MVIQTCNSCSALQWRLPFVIGVVLINWLGSCIGILINWLGPNKLMFSFYSKMCVLALLGSCNLEPNITSKVAYKQKLHCKREALVPFGQKKDHCQILGYKVSDPAEL